MRTTMLCLGAGALALSTGCTMLTEPDEIEIIPDIPVLTPARVAPPAGMPGLGGPKRPNARPPAKRGGG